MERVKEIDMEVISLIYNCGKEAATSYLNRFKVRQLKEYAAFLNLSLWGDKATMIELIVNHYTFIKLKDDMAKRPKWV